MWTGPGYVREPKGSPRRRRNRGITYNRKPHRLRDRRKKYRRGPRQLRGPIPRLEAWQPEPRQPFWERVKGIARKLRAHRGDRHETARIKRHRV